MGDNATLPERAVKDLHLEGLTQLVSSKGTIKGTQPPSLAGNWSYKGKTFTFLDIGEIIIHYGAEVVEVDAYASRLAGADSLHRAQRGAYNSAHLEGAVPDGATHYCLGREITTNEAYRKKNEAFSYDCIPIVFLRKNE